MACGKFVFGVKEILTMRYTSNFIEEDKHYILEKKDFFMLEYCNCIKVYDFNDCTYQFPKFYVILYLLVEFVS